MRETSTRFRPLSGAVQEVERPKVWIGPENLGIAGWTSADQIASVDQAMAYFTDRIRDHRQDGFARVVRALLGQSTNELDKAMADCDQAVRIDPRSSIAFKSRACVWATRKEFDKTTADCDEVIRLDSRNAMAYSVRTGASICMCEWDKAMTDLDQFIRLDPQLSGALVMLGCIWAEKMAFGKAVTDFNEAIRINPQSVSAYFNRAGGWCCKQEYDNSIADSDAATRLNPADTTTLSLRAYCWGAQHEFDRAISDFTIADYNEVIRLDPENDAPYGLVWNRQQEIDIAITEGFGDFGSREQLGSRGTDRGLHGFEVEDETKALDEFLPGVLFANANDVVLLDKVAPTAATLADLVPSPRGQFKKPTSVTDDTIAENTRGAAEIARLIGVTNDVAKAQQEMKRTFDSGGPGAFELSRHARRGLCRGGQLRRGREMADHGDRTTSGHQGKERVQRTAQALPGEKALP